jgi:hypothetical protein
MAVVAGFHVREEDPQTVDHSPEIDPKAPFPVGGGQRLERSPTTRHTCVQAEQIDRTQLCSHSLAELVHLLRVTDIGLDRQGIDASGPQRLAGSFE